MPRLTNQDFLKRHHFLVLLWEDQILRSLFSALEPMEQLQLHQYYQTLNYGDDAEIVSTRTTVNRNDSPLTQQAGRAWKQLLATLERGCVQYSIHYDPKDLHRCAQKLSKAIRKAIRPSLANQKAKAKSPVVKRNFKGMSHHSVRPIMRPEIEMQQLARATLLLAHHLTREELLESGEIDEDSEDAYMLKRIDAFMDRLRD
jgi:hypothetical protein